jgi:hypothetical protein
MKEAEHAPDRRGVLAARSAAADLVDRAIEAIGGARALANLKTISIRGHEMVWEHEYSSPRVGRSRT